MEALTKRISVSGLGYVGLPTAALLASRSFSVTGIDINEKVVAALNSGNVHIVEPELDVLVSDAVNAGKLKASTTPEPADVFLIAVPTPFADGNEPDLRFVEAAMRALAPVLAVGNLVVLESTSPVGTTRRMCELLAEVRPDLIFPHDDAGNADVSVAYCPERILPGSVLRELVENARVVGGVSPACTKKALEFYKSFVSGDCVASSAEAAEMTKLVENSFRDVNIAFANEISMICHKHGIDPWEVINLANYHPRVNILQPGTGVGGHCIAVDPWFIVSGAPADSKLIRTAREVNDAKPEWVVARVTEVLDGLKSPKIACLGLSYKPDIDDLRESPALRIVEKLAKDCDGALLVADPYQDVLPDNLAGFAHARLVSAEGAIRDADVIVALVKHSAFAGLSRAILTSKPFVDACGLLR